MAIAQMNWGRMRHALTHPRMAEFAASLDAVYRQAEQHPGFVWRIPDAEAAAELAALGHDEMISATVSVWESVETLRAYTFQSRHGAYLKRAGEWFETVEGPQLVMWEVPAHHRPNFQEAFARLQSLRDRGPTQMAFGWPD